MRDEGGVILTLSLGSTAPGGGAAVVNTSRYVLVRRDNSALVGLDKVSSFGPECAGIGPQPPDRVCIRSAAILDPKGTYTLLVDTLVAFENGKADTLTDLSIDMPPVGGAVTIPKGDFVDLVVVEYNTVLDSSSTADIVDAATSAPLAAPGCRYSVGGLAFTCRLLSQLTPGRKVGAAIHPDPGGTVKPGTFKAPPPAAKYSTKNAEDEAPIYFKVAYAHEEGSDAGTLRFRYEKPLYGWPHVVVDRFEFRTGPYVDVLLATKKETGFMNAGVNATSTLVNAFPGVTDLGLTLKPHVESDKKASVVNAIPLDVNVVAGLLHLIGGEIANGPYALRPSGGYEWGQTWVGKDVTRPESNNPSRFKAGAAGVINWLRDESLGQTPGGLSLEGSVQRYWVTRRPADALDHHDNFTVSASYLLDEHRGISLTWRGGDLPPLFKAIHTLDLGFALVY
jgi:hypothetical protein